MRRGAGEDCRGASSLVADVGEGLRFVARVCVHAKILWAANFCVTQVILSQVCLACACLQLSKRFARPTDVRLLEISFKLSASFLASGVVLASCELGLSSEARNAISGLWIVSCDA